MATLRTSGSKSINKRSPFGISGKLLFILERREISRRIGETLFIKEQNMVLPLLYIPCPEIAPLCPILVYHSNKDFFAQALEIPNKQDKNVPWRRPSQNVK